MNLLPYENIEYTTPFSATEVKEIIANNIALSSGLNKNSIYDYEGHMEGNSFTIRRILKSYRNSYLPTATGVISKYGTGSRIELKLRLHKVIYIFTIVISLFLLLHFIMPFIASANYEYDPQILESLDDEVLKESLRQGLENMNHSVQFDWMDIPFIFAPYLLATVAFNWEAKQLKYKLKSILKINEN